MAEFPECAHRGPVPRSLARSMTSRLPLTCLVLTAVLAAQDPAFPPLGADPTGKVVDEDGKAIPGAKVTVVWDAAASAPWRWSIAQVLAHAPLPSALSDGDGEFVLPLTREQRRLGGANEGAFALRIEKDGYVEWIEPLPLGLWGFLGTRATLRKPAPIERVRLAVADPVPGMIAVVRTSVADRWGGIANQIVRSAPVPADGKLEIVVPWLASPVLVAEAAGMQGTPVSCEAIVVFPGRTTSFVAIDPARENGIPRAESPATRTLPVRRSDGAAVTGLQALYRSPDGCEVWFPCEGAALRVDERLQLASVRAQGCADAHPDTEATEVVLEPAGAARTPRAESPPDQNAGGDLTSLRIRVVDESEHPLPGVTLRFSDDARVATLWSGQVAVTDEQGFFEAAQAPCSQFEVLALDDAHLPTTAKVLPKKGEPCHPTIVLAAQTVYRVISTTATGAPAPFLRMRDSATQRVEGIARRAQVLVATDSQGRALLRRRPDAEVRLSYGQRGEQKGGVPEDGVIRIEGPAYGAALLRLPFDFELDQFEWQYRGGGSSGGISRRPGCFGLLLEPPSSEQELAIYSAPGKPPLLVEGSDVSTTKLRIGTTPVLDRHEIVRRIPLRITATPEPDLGKLVIAPTTMHHGGAMIGTRHGNLFRLATGTEPEIALTFHGGLKCNVLHPDYLRQEIEIPAQDPAEKVQAPMALALEPGARIEIVLTNEQAGAARSPMTRITRKSDSKMMWFGMDSLKKPKDGEALLRIVVPFAFPPGEYQLICGSGQGSTVDFTVEGTKPVVVELAKTEPKK